MRTVAALAGALIAVAALAACAGPGTAPDAGGPGAGTSPSPSGAAADPGPTPGDGDPTAPLPSHPPIDPDDIPPVLPESFPWRIPLITGAILDAEETDEGWVVWISVDDPAGAYREAVDALGFAGFTAAADTATADGGRAELTGEEYRITVVAGVDTDYGPAVCYTVERSKSGR